MLRALFNARPSRSFVAVNFAAVLERADEQLLPSVFAYVAASMGIDPSHLGLLTLARALAQAVASPVGGLAGQHLHRGRVIGTGCALWALCAVLFASVSSLAAAICVWALGGVGLALVVPNTQSLTADMHDSKERGTAFGILHLCATLGGMLGALFATNIGETEIKAQ